MLERIDPQIQPGSLIVFDDYIVSPTWREDEHKAFQEAVAQFGSKYRYLAFAIITKQAVIIIE